MSAPKRPKGILVRQDEYDMISQALIAMADQAKKHGQQEAYALIRRFVVRLKQSIFDADGVPEETMRRMADAVEAGLAKQDLQATQVAVAAMLAAVIRQDHDPGHTIARVLAPSFVVLAQRSATTQRGQVAAVTMRQLHERLEAERASFAENGWSSPEETFDYIVEVVEFCAAELHHGKDPFSTEESEVN